jgi:hypothetical protein
MFYHNGLAARGAVTAVQLAAEGAYASHTALEGDAGMLAAFRRPRPPQVPELFADRPEILAVFFKPVPACNFAQTPAQVALALAQRERVRAADIDSVSVRVTKAAALYPGCDASGPFEHILQAKNRLLLARLFAQPANVLVLDEPTNDLDIDTLELLEELLDTFDGTVLLVTHDREFLDNVVTSVIAMEGDRIAEYVGGWKDYLRQAPRAGTGERAGDAAPRQAAAAASRAVSSARRKKTFKEEREYAALPERIAALEDEQRQLQQEAAGPGFYREPAERIEFVLGRIETLHDELESALARWLTLEDIGR